MTKTIDATTASAICKERTLRRLVANHWVSVVAGAILAVVASSDVWAQEGVGRVREKGLEFIQSIAQKEVDTYIKARPSDIDRAYKNYDYLVVPGKLDELEGYIGAAGSDEEKGALTLLHKFLTLQTVRKGSAPEVDGANNYLADTEIELNDEAIPLRDVINRMAHEADRSTRRQWSFAYKEFLDSANVYLAQAIHLANTEAKALGYDGYLALLSDYLNFDIETTRTLADAVISSTDDIYGTLLAEQVTAVFGGELGIDAIRFYDMPRIWGMERFDEAAKAKDAYKIAGKTFESAGLKLKSGSAGDVGQTPATKESSRNGIVGYFDGAARNAMTLGGKPFGTLDALSGMLREAGRMVYHAKAGGSYFEYHFLGDPSMGYAVGYLFEGLAANPAWLAEHTDLSGEDAAAVGRAMAFKRAFDAREAAVRIRFLPEIYDTDVKEPGELFESIAEPVRGWGHTEVDRVMYLQADDNFDCVARLRGMILAAGLEKALVTQHGDEWFKKKDTGKTLATIWAKGSAMSAEEYASSLDLSGLDAGALLTSIQSMAGQGQ